MKERKKERIFISQPQHDRYYMIYSEHSKQVIESVKKIHHRTIYRQTGLRGTAGIGIKNPESHPGAPCSLSPQLQMPIFIFGFKRRPGTANKVHKLIKLLSHKKNYVPQFLKQRDINSYYETL
jgi:hypothetical protein